MTYVTIARDDDYKEGYDFAIRESDQIKGGIILDHVGPIAYLDAGGIKDLIDRLEALLNDGEGEK